MGVFEIIVGVATILGAIASLYSAFSLYRIRDQLNISGSNNNTTSQKGLGWNNQNTNTITYNEFPSKKK